MKSCKKGYYYCNTDQKCKPIPDGHTVRDDGFLMKEDKKIKKIIKQLRKSVKSHAKQADTLEKKLDEEGLRAWFGKSSGTTKSGRKVKGWVQVGGKYDGKPCARQPGQKTTPKCTSSSKRSSMSDKERDSAARRKRAADPGQPQKSGAAAPTMVSTDPKKKMKEEYTSLSLRLEVPKTQSEFTKGLMFRESLETNSGMLFVFDRIEKQSFHMTETTIPLDIAFIREDGIVESIKSLEPKDNNPVYSEGAIELAIEVNRGWFAENNVEVGDELVVEYIVEDPKEKYRSETGTISDIINEVKDKKGKGSGSKDACYHKVKSRYSVWPSAYASGALVKCRKVGAANWGNKSESLDIQNADGKIIAGVVDIIGPDHLKPITNDSGVWRGTEQVVEEVKRDEYGDPIGGPKISKKEKAKNLASNTPDKDHTTDTAEGASYGIFKGDGKPKGAMSGFAKKKSNPYGKGARLKMLIKGIAEKERSKAGVTSEEVVDEAKVDKVQSPIYSLPRTKARNERKFGKAGSLEPQGYFGQKPSQAAELSKKRTDEHKAKRGVKTKGMNEDSLDEKCWKGYEKKGMKTMFGKRYPNCVKKKVGESMVNWREDLNIEEGAAWTKKSGKSASGGLNEKGRKSYERDNPGSDLKAPSKKVGNPRRKSFCARMKGMKKKLTSAKTARDPDSRINKSLRAWNC